GRRYLDDTMVLETTFTTAAGSVVLTDALAVGRNERGHQLGAGAVGAVLRRVIGVSGSVDLELSCVPRPGYGSVSPTLQRFDDRVLWRTDDCAMALSSTVPLDTDAGTASARLTLRPG